MSVHGDHPQEPASGTYANPVGDALARGETPTMRDLVARCTDLEDVVHKAVIVLASVSRRRMERARRGEHPAVLVDARHLADLEDAVDRIRGRAGYVADLRDRTERAGRGR